MVKTKEEKIVTFSYRVETTWEDIRNGECGLPRKCMEKVANYRALINLLGEGSVEQLRLDGSQIKFNYNGYRWYATTPPKAKTNLIWFDVKKPVAPHSYTVKAIRGTKIQKHTAERQAVINAARDARKAAGLPDKKHVNKTMHQRVIGLGTIV